MHPPMAAKILVHPFRADRRREPMIILAATFHHRAIDQVVARLTLAAPPVIGGFHLGSSQKTENKARYPRQNGLAVALRELGRIERTLFILDWLQSVDLRRRVHAGLNKGEARNALARAVFFNRLGEIRDRSFEQQRYRASGLNLVTAAIVLWNTVYLERAMNALRGHDQGVDDALLQYLSPLGWEHINLTGDYLWRNNAKIGAGKFRPLRPLQPA